MTKQEEIREYTAEFIHRKHSKIEDNNKWESMPDWWRSETYLEVDQLFEYLHSKGVVIFTGGECDYAESVAFENIEPLIEVKDV